MICVAVAYFFHFFFSKFAVTGEFSKCLIIVSVFVKEIGGNSVNLALFEFVGIKGKVISCGGFFFGGNSVAIIGIEINFVTFGNKVPFSVVAEHMELESIIEGKFFGRFVFPVAANRDFVAEIIFILCGKNNVLSGLGIIRFGFFEFFTSGKNKDEAKNQKNDFFQNNASFHRVIKVSLDIIPRFDRKIKGF